MRLRTELKYILLILALFFLGDFKTVSASDCNLSNNDIRARVLNLPSQLELRYNDKVREYVDFFVTDNRKLSATLLGRATMYFPMMEATIAANQLPDELKYLPVIESALVPYLTSSAGAGGLWQFMKPTAEQFGLKVTNTIDERRDAEKSTQAACAYLKRLFNIYKDWTLVLAAYNCGDGVLNRAMKKTSSRSYWDIQQYLPQQTQEFVPKFIAAQYMMNYYYEHDIVPIPMEEDYVFSGTIKVFDKIDLDKVAADYQINPEVIKRLNAVFVKGFIPESKGEYNISLPESKIVEFAIANNLLDNAIAYSPASLTRAKQVIALAEAKEKEEIRQRETSPFENLPKQSSPIVNARPTTIRFEDEPAVRVVKLTKGKSLSDIAKENGTDLASLMEFNKIDNKYPPKIGDAIRIRI